MIPIQLPACGSTARCCWKIVVNSRGNLSHERAAERGSPVPLLAALPLHNDAGRIADFDPDRTSAGSIGPVDLLGDDSLRAKPASMFEHRRAITDDVFVEHDARRGMAQQPRQRSLAVEEWEITQILTIMLDKVEGVENRAMCSGGTEIQFN